MPESSAVTIKPNYERYEDAVNKFIQGNTVVAYKDLYAVLKTSPTEDFLYLSLAHKFNEMGFFSLSNDALNQIDDDEIWQRQTKLLRSVYAPKQTLSYDEEIYLAGLYSDIFFHNLAFEVVKELSKNDKLLKYSDYACYMLSLAYFETKEYKQALGAINKALAIYPENVNYLKTKAQILCELKDYKQATKIIDNLIANPNVIDNKDFLAIKAYTLAKSAKKDYLAKYHLAEYFYIKSDYTRATKTLNQCLNLRKKYYPALTLLGDINVKNGNIEKAQEYYEKSYKINKRYPQTLFGLGDINYRKGNVTKALEFFLAAQKYNKNYLESILYSAMAYNALNQQDKALEFCRTALSVNSNYPEAYYVLSKIEKDREIAYLKRATSLNLLYIDAWLDLANLAIKNNDLKLAKTYLLPVQYIDTNNYKVYYYQGLIYKKESNFEAAMINFKKSLNINPNYEPSLLEVNSEI